MRMVIFWLKITLLFLPTRVFFVYGTNLGAENNRIQKSYFTLRLIGYGKKVPRLGFEPRSVWTVHY